MTETRPPTAEQFGKAWLMKQHIIIALAAAGTLFLTMGCKSLLPSGSSSEDSRWHSYDQVESAFAVIVPYQTNTNALRTMGFYPATSPNIKVLSYVEIIQIFIPNSGIRQKDLPPAVRECIEAREQSCAYVIELNDLHSHRYGNVLLDMFGFKRNTHEVGWTFKGLLLIKNGIVLYKLSSGEPKLARDEKTTHPLGPLQELDKVVFSIVSVTKVSK